MVVPVIHWEQFHELVRSVARNASTKLPYAAPGAEDFLFPEDLMQLWEDAIWDTILKFFYSYACDQLEFPKGLQAVYDLYSLENVNFSNISPASIPREAKKLVEAARSAVLSYIRQNSPNQKCYVLFDNMDKYPIRNGMFASVISGFLACINKLNAQHKELRIIVSLPEEVERFISSRSSNLEKDFYRMCKLRWKPGELLRIACHRYKLYIQIHQPEHYDKVAHLDFSRREHIQFFLDKLFPFDVVNRLRQRENPVAYIIRHTQLQPRHIIFIFNRIISKAREAVGGGIWQFDSQYIRAGVEEVESIIAQHILAPYNLIYPNLIAACQDVLPELPPICSLSQLDAVERRFGRNKLEEDIANPWRILTEMGVLGVVEDQEPDPHRVLTRYIYGAFHFNSTSGFGFANNRQYCFHPIFSKFFGLRRSKEDSQLAVYPANIGDVNRAGLFFDEKNG